MADKLNLFFISRTYPEKPLTIVYEKICQMKTVKTVSSENAQEIHEHETFSNLITNTCAFPFSVI